MELHPETFDLGTALSEACQVIRPTAQHKRIMLLNESCPELAEVHLDKQRFKHILFNLLSNAVKFTKDGGTVEIRERRLDPARFSVSVRDTGIGIAKADLQRIFKEFEQVDSSTSRLYHGTGLGLALTRRLVELQHGDISVDSEPRRGTTFTIELPFQAA